MESDDTDALPLNDEEDGFIYFRLTGDRFDAVGMPAESAVEVQRVSELVYEVARAIWLERNPGRRRVPTEFVKALDLRLVSIGEGSAMPQLRMMAPPPLGPTDEDYRPIFAATRHRIVETIHSLETDRELPSQFPRSALPALKRVGRSLRADEKLALGEPRALADRAQRVPVEATLDATTRDVLKQIDAALANQPSPEALEGVVTEFDGVQQTFRLRDGDGRFHVCRLAYHEPDVAGIVKSALAADGVTAPDVRVEGIGLRDVNDRVDELWDVAEVSVVRTYSEKALMKKLSALRELSDGWWGPGSEKPDLEALHEIELAMPTLARLDAHLAVGANADGAVVLEWARGTVAYTAHLEPGHRIFLCAEDVEDDAEEPWEYEGDYSTHTLVRFIETGNIDA